MGEDVPDHRSVRLLGALSIVAVCACERQPEASNRADSEATASQTIVGGETANAAAVSCEAPDLCFRDTARGRSLDHEPGWTVDAHWMVFGAAEDSVELYGTVGGRSDGVRLTVSVGAGGGIQERDASGNTASFVRTRLGHDGVMTVTISIDDDLGDTVEYELRLRRVASGRPSGLRATGEHAVLEILSARETDRFSVVPRSAAASAGDLSRWSVLRRRYKVALVPDSLYQICNVPCSAPQTVTLRLRGRATVRY
jgi:hypothetical protein